MVMEVHISASPRFRFQLTAKEVEMLKILALAHYDGRCQSTAKVGGFIYGWGNMAYGLKSDELADVSGDWTDLDLACKILEPSSYIGFEVMMPTGTRLYMRIRAMLQAYSADFYPKWQATITV
jgi:hypothetical protein